jgi:hypothetical protein
MQMNADSKSVVSSAFICIHLRLIQTCARRSVRQPEGYRDRGDHLYGLPVRERKQISVSRRWMQMNADSKSVVSSAFICG